MHRMNTRENARIFDAQGCVPAYLLSNMSILAFTTRKEEEEEEEEEEQQQQQHIKLYVR